MRGNAGFKDVKTAMAANRNRPHSTAVGLGGPEEKKNPDNKG
jgi:hypothetical protein